MTEHGASASASSTEHGASASAESPGREVLAGAEEAARAALAVAESTRRDVLAGAEVTARDALAVAESTARDALASAEVTGRDVLAEAAVELTAKVSQLSQLVDELHDRAGRVRVAARIVVAVLLALGIGSLVYNQSASDARLAEANTRLDAVVAVQSRIRTDTFCPLYEFLTNSESSHEREVYAGGPTAYDAAFAGLRRQRATLQCAAQPPPP